MISELCDTTGCSEFVVRNATIKRLGNNAKLQFNGSANIGGVGDVTTESSGIYSVRLPFANERNAVLTGPSLPKITDTFPQYPLDDEVKDIQRFYEKGGENVFDLPSLPSSIGGDVDMMIGIKYLGYHPETIFNYLLDSPFTNLHLKTVTKLVWRPRSS